MRERGLNFGCIDMIYSQNNRYVFLEVNPVGQYDYVSQNCNYSIHEFIAKQL